MAKGKPAAASFYFPAQCSQVRTLADGGIRVQLDLPETAIREAAMLMECKREMIPLLVEVRADAVVAT